MVSVVLVASSKYILKGVVFRISSRGSHGFQCEHLSGSHDSSKMLESIVS